MSSRHYCSTIKIIKMKIDTNIILHAIPAFVLLIIIEAIYLVKEHRFTNTKKDILANAGLGLGFVILSPVTKGINLIVYTLAYEHRIFDLPHNLWLAWILCFIADDFTFYWCHRMSHEVRFLWASHQGTSFRRIFFFVCCISSIMDKQSYRRISFLGMDAIRRFYTGHNYVHEIFNGNISVLAAH